MSNAFLHVVLAKFYDGVSDELRRGMYQKMACLGEKCGAQEAGIIAWQVDWNTDQRKGYQLMEVGLFVNRNAFEIFRAHPVHCAFSQEMSQLADWIVGDMLHFVMPPIL